MGLVALVDWSVILLLGTGGQSSCDEGNVELCHTELSTRVRGARTHTSLDGAMGALVGTIPGREGG